MSSLALEPHKAFSRNPIEALANRDGTTDQKNNRHFSIRKLGTPCQGIPFGILAWWGGGLIKGDLNFKKMVEKFKNKTGNNSHILSAGQIGREFTYSLTVTNLTPFMIQLIEDSDQDFVPYYSKIPGARKFVLDLGGALVTANVVDFDFTTQNFNLPDAPVSAETEVNVTYGTSETLTGDALETAVLLNAGILSATYDVVAHSLTVIAKPNFVIDITTTATVTGGTPPTITSQTLTDTSTVSGVVDGAEEGSVHQLYVTLASVEGFLPGMKCEIPTGEITHGVMNEYPVIRQVDTVNKILYWTDGTRQLPEDGVTVRCVAGIRWAPNDGKEAPAFEAQFNINDNDAEAANLVYIYENKLDSVDGIKYSDGVPSEATFNFMALDAWVIAQNRFRTHELETNYSIVGAG